MTPSARLQSAIEILDLILASARDNGAAADTIVAKWFSTRRFAGSKDRRAVRDLVYRAIRSFGEMPVSGRSAFGRLADYDETLAPLFDGSPYGPAPLEKGEVRDEPVPMPAWLARMIPEVEHAALLERAPLDLRANRLRTTREELLALWPEATAIPHTEDGLRFTDSFNVETSEPWQGGLVEVQDAGSQMIVAACAAAAGMTVVDLCAGGGGKTLALASAMRGEGRLIAADTDKRRLSQLPARAERAGAAVEVQLLDGGHEVENLAPLAGQADVVLVDAPCSGSGTLRRNPEARWRLQPARLDKLVQVQRHVLDLAVPLVKPGGAIVYAVCSLIAREGAGQVDAFLARYPGWTSVSPFDHGRPAGKGRVLSPGHDGTDGFFVARLVSPC
ncbi:RsmB/NOP family class I SAM-dependent RNA methyltransferase [Sphingomonas sp. SUN039]|uniref:RsmB/NOP family class I SAM-dependent RNA methyltransferase n=1 Tax=Sphingomonas sp. SUN039 TaxID=2937787 RepID=UPI00216406BA|nr:RsmB/NOP family class I SAM-dependent RNA methyltransferase [Sphingomonas sp. SUN039]UVO53323.1 RsmB/NOP family class I SAM-dependent RNA methyltransferase [Sphingomonas sp. SUN039]